MPPVYRIVTRIQDQDDFSGSLTNGYYLKYDSGSGTFTLAAVDLSAYAPLAGASFTGAVIVDSDAASAFAVGPNGDTNPAFRVVGNVSSTATGLSVTGNAVGAGVTLTVLSSGTNEALTLAPKGTGAVVVAGTLQLGTASAERVIRAGTYNGEIGFGNSGGNFFYANGNTKLFNVWSSGGFAWTNSAAIITGDSTVDTALLRSAAGVVKVTDGSTGTGSLIATQLAAAVPASGAGNSLTLAGSAAVSGNTNGGDTVVQLVAGSGSGTAGRFVIKDTGGTARYAFSSGSFSILTAGGETGVSWNGVNFNLGRNGGSDTFGIEPGNSGNRTAFSTNGSFFQFSKDVTILGGAAHLGFNFDTGFARSSAAVVRVTNGSTGTGSILSSVLVEANTAGSGSPNVLTAAESGTLLTNEGSTAQNYHTLPSAAAGLQFDFVVQDSDGMRIVAATGDTIRDVATVSSAAGYIQSTTVGSTLRLVAINATEWIVTAKQGTWTIDS